MESERIYLKIEQVAVHDLRFPTSATLAGSDAMNPHPEYSAAYVVLRTNDGHEGHGLSFTIGRGNELVCGAIESLAHLILGVDVAWLRENPSQLSRRLTGDFQLRWVGPNKGTIHLASGALINAAWDLFAKLSGKPVWRLLFDMSPEELLGIIDFRHLRDHLVPEEALSILREGARGKHERLARLKARGYPAYTTAAGWIGYSDDLLVRHASAAMEVGFNSFKMKVGQSVSGDKHRLRLLRDTIGPDRTLMIDANQMWEVDEAINWVRSLAEFDPYFIEEPTNPDDIEGHRAIRDGLAPIKVATGEMVPNAVMFKQFMARGAIDIAQPDAARLGGLNELFTTLVLAAKFRIPVWPHAGGVGLCEYAQHHSMVDFLVVSGSGEGRGLEYVDHLHEHFVHPCVIREGAYQLPVAPGFSIEMHSESVEKYRFNPGPYPAGEKVWV